MKKEFNERERRIALAVMQVKAEPYCTECGGSCIVVLEEISSEKLSDIWTACTMCGNEMVWTTTPNQVEIMKRIIALTEQQEGRVLEPYELIQGSDGKCIGLCGGICHECWRPEDDIQDSDDNSGDPTVPEPF